MLRFSYEEEACNGLCFGNTMQLIKIMVGLTISTNNYSQTIELESIGPHFYVISLTVGNGYHMM